MFLPGPHHHVEWTNVVGGVELQILENYYTIRHRPLKNNSNSVDVGTLRGESDLNALVQKLCIHVMDKRFCGVPETCGPLMY
jgi:hypothetical protein